ncbi:oxidoreductase [Corynebacterium deserti GIMN1.010]|uniref:Oxidoreductase n=1 Tax=Corynebacterium deserti GIMN1.010 TaxID=931089 RepID=A0A0M4CBZ9_9CORY|nr:aldo/keto reductase [Corynebacterium deserti]ALC04616.1 oxidoreductase [Corynebacterium deserti GIMN1.010]
MTVIKGTEFDVFPLNLGGNTFGWTSDREATFAVLDAFVEAGGNFVDTADSYSAWAPGNEGGESEREIGAWIKKNGADKLIIATKSGALEAVAGRSREATFQAVEGSLERLGVESIDIFYYHYDDEAVSIDEQVAIANDLIAEGKIKHLALSNYTPQRLAEFFEKSEGTPAQPVALQPHYNLLARKDYENDIQPLVDQYSVAVFPYFSLAAGLLTGKYTSKEDIAGKARAGQLEGYATDEAFAVVSELVAVAKELNAAPTTVALAWLLAHGVTAPIASVSKVEQLADLLAVKDLTLSEEHVARLDKASQSFA